MTQQGDAAAAKVNHRQAKRIAMSFNLCYFPLSLEQNWNETVSHWLVRLAESEIHSKTFLVSLQLAPGDGCNSFCSVYGGVFQMAGYLPLTRPKRMSAVTGRPMISSDQFNGSTWWKCFFYDWQLFRWNWWKPTGNRQPATGRSGWKPPRNQWSPPPPKPLLIG